MSLHEIDQKILKKEGVDLVYRFLQDFAQKINLFIWQHLETEGDDLGIDKFQLAHRHHILEWKIDGSLKYGIVDEGENPLGMKRSPIMIMDEKVDRKAYDLLLNYLKGEQPEEIKREIDFVRDVMERHTTFAN